MLRVKIKNKLLEQQPTAQPVQQPGQTPQNQTGEIKTFGDLKKAINAIITKQRTDAAMGGAKDLAVDMILNVIPGAGAAKTAFDFFKNIYNATDDKKTNTVLDKLNVDDEYSKIVDDTVEMAFLKSLSDMIMKKSDAEVIPRDYNINLELQNYLKRTYKSRTLSMGT